MRTLKFILFISLLITASSLQAQDFSLRTLLGYGIEVNSRLDYTVYQSSVTVEPRLRIDNIEFSSINTSLQSDSSVSYWTGLQVGYFPWQQKDKAVEVLMQGLISNGDKKLLGVGIEYTTKEIILKVTAAKEFKNNTAVFMGCIGIPILK